MFAREGGVEHAKKKLRGGNFKAEIQDNRKTHVVLYSSKDVLNFEQIHARFTAKFFKTDKFSVRFPTSSHHFNKNNSGCVLSQETGA